MSNTKKAHEDDVVELVEDLPEYGFKRGQRGVVIEAFEKPAEGYDLEFEDEEGNFLGLAYAVKPHQIINLSYGAFEQGLTLLNQGKKLEAARAFKRAIELKPNYIDVLADLLTKAPIAKHDWERCTEALRFVLELNPKYELGRHNLAVAYHKYGNQKAQSGDLNTAIYLFHHALMTATTEKLTKGINQSLSAAYTSLGIETTHKSDFARAVFHFIEAYHAHSDETTRGNLGTAYFNAGEFYLDQGDYQKAVGEFERALIAGHLTPALFNDYGLALAHMGRVDEAIWEFERGLELAPENETIQANLNEIKDPLKADYSRVKVKPKFDSVPPAQLQEFAPAA